MGKRRAAEGPGQSGGHSGTPRAKARTIPTSTRPCTLTQACTGNMTAALRLVDTGDRKPDLWWTCPVCKTAQRAQRTGAVPAPHTMRNLLDEGYDEIYGPLPVNAELQEASAHIRAIIHETEGE